MKKYLEVIIHILIWSLGFLLIFNETSTIGDFKKGKGPYWVTLLFGMVINQVIFYVTTFYLVPTLLRLKKIKKLVAVLIVGLFGNYSI